MIYRIDNFKFYTRPKAENVLGNITPRNRWQIKETTSSNNVSQLDFDNLVAGKTYRITLNLRVDNDAGQDLSINATDPDGSTLVLTTVGMIQNAASGTVLQPRFSAVNIFIAQASGTLSFSISSSTGTLQAGTSAILEELSNYEQTTNF